MLDAIRAIAALLVFFGHIRAGIFSSIKNINDPTLLEKTFFFITGLGHQSVIVFFVLSGFFVGGSVVSAKQTFSSKKYLIARILRLEMVIVPALVVTFLIDKWISYINPMVLTGKYYQIWASGPNPLKEYSLSLKTFLGNICFLQTIKTPVFGTNSPFWSLANEFWYYIAFPAITTVLAFSCKREEYTKRIVSLLLVITISVLLPNGIILGFIPWLMGVCVFFFYKKQKIKASIYIKVITFIFFLGSLIYSKTELSKNLFIPADWVIGLFFSIFCWSIVSCKKPEPVNRKLKFLEFLSESSYSLYALHFPLLMLFMSYKVLGYFSGINLYVVYLAISVSIFIIISFIWFFFERNTDLIRNKILSRIS
ncbi:MAG: acyltransferase [Proteobacteria bacterium]|nr:acyltransferase [Pseudomonadota bacterium]